MTSMLRVRDLKVEKAGQTICSVARLDIGRGQQLALIGPNGSGKTTLLRVAAGLENEYSGECHVAARFRDRVYVHQSPYLFRGSVLFNTRYALAARNMPKAEQVEVARRWLDMLGIGHLQHRSCRHLSGGERRRVALARALAAQPDFLLLDEPLADLDEEGISIVCRVLSTQSQTTVLIASPVALPEAMQIPSVSLTIDC